MAFDTVRTSKLLIDGDLILYRCSSATEHAVRWDDENWVLHANLQESKELVAAALAELKTRIEADETVIFLSGSSNFRYDVDPNYKSKRKDTRKPIVYPELRKWLEDTFLVMSMQGLEADDLLGIDATHPDNIGKTIIASEDKDMLTIPGKLWRQGQLVDVSQQDADRYWMQQTLTGDPTDGYKGCPGIGEKKAEAILGTNQPLATMWNNVVAAYRKAGLTYEDALMNARLARILRHEDYNDGKIQLWEPERAIETNAA